MKKTNFKRIALLSLGLMASVPAYSISAGAAAGAAVGTAAAVGLIAYGVHKHHKNKAEKRNCSQCNKGKQYSNTQSKNEMKNDKKMYKSKLKEHQRDLRKLEKQKRAGSIEASQHRSEISKLETMVDDLDARIKRS